MPAPAMSREAFGELWDRCGGSPERVAKELGVSTRAVYRRRERMANDGRVLHTADAVSGQTGDPQRRWTPLQMRPAQRLNLDITDGVVIVFSDAHYWPGIISASHSALLAVIGQLNPRIVIANGDMLDGATISRHDRIGWERRPALKDELKACQDRLGEVEAAAGKAELVWNLGNHDARFETYMSKNAPAFEGMPGTTLPERFPNWQFSVSTVLNAREDHPVMVKHRYRNGVHAAYNNTVTGGISVVTGHLHRLLVTPWGDYRGRRYGVDTGCLADPLGPQFQYTEDAPSPHGEGFAVLTFRGGRLQPPELVEVVDGVAVFRGQPVTEKAEAA
jgi:hypothetical protein